MEQCVSEGQELVWRLIFGRMYMLFSGTTLGGSKLTKPLHHTLYQSTPHIISKNPL